MTTQPQDLAAAREIVSDCPIIHTSAADSFKHEAIATIIAKHMQAEREEREQLKAQLEEVASALARAQAARNSNADDRDKALNERDEARREVERLSDIIRKEAWLAQAPESGSPYIAFEEYDKLTTENQQLKARIKELEQ